MEYVDGWPLSDFLIEIREKKLEVKEYIRIIYEIL